MRRHTLLALTMATGLALPIGYSATALAVSDDQRAVLGAASAMDSATMEAAIATVLKEMAEDRPLAEVLDELAGALLELGVTDAYKAEFAVALVEAAQDLALAGDLPGVTVDAAGEAAAEAVLVRAQNNPALIAAVISRASAMAAGDIPGGQGTAVLGAFAAASISNSIDLANRDALRSALVQAAVVQADDSASNGEGEGSSFGDSRMGAGPNLGGMTLVGATTGNPGRGGGRSAEQVGSGDPISPN